MTDDGGSIPGKWGLLSGRERALFKEILTLGLDRGDAPPKPPLIIPQGGELEERLPSSVLRCGGLVSRGSYTLEFIILHRQFML